MVPSPRLSYLVTDQVPPSSQRMVVALTSDLLIKMARLALTFDLLVRKAYPALTSNHVGTNPIIISERPSTHIHQHDSNPTTIIYEMAQHLQSPA